MKAIIFAVAVAALSLCSTAEAGPTLVRRGVTRRPVAIKQPVVLRQQFGHVHHGQAIILQQQQPCYVPGSQSILLFQR